MRKIEGEWDNAVEGTSDDAAISKLSAARLGYYEDDYICHFVSKKKAVRRSPIINRGYFARVAARDMVVTKFLVNTKGDSQIISLGAGSDTLYFRLAKDKRQPTAFVEIDLPAVVNRKKKLIEQSSELKAIINEKEYYIFDVDITDTEELMKKLASIEILDFSKPTLFISECVLVYIEPEKTMKLLKSIQSNFSNCAMFVYEQIRPDDAFGKMMMKNLKNRGCPLKGIIAHRSPEMQIDRFVTHAGFSSCECYDMNDIYYKGLRSETKKRIEKLEIFDEFEEWHLMSAHYAIVLAKNIINKDSIELKDLTLI